MLTAVQLRSVYSGSNLALVEDDENYGSTGDSIYSSIVLQIDFAYS